MKVGNNVFPVFTATFDMNRIRKINIKLTSNSCASMVLKRGERGCIEMSRKIQPNGLSQAAMEHSALISRN